MLNTVLFGLLDYMRLIFADESRDVSQYNNSALHLAASQGFAGIVQYLLADVRVSPDALDNRALTSASDKSHTEVVRVLLNDARVDPTENHDSIHAAITTDHPEVVGLLLADPTVRTTDVDRSVLKCAARQDFRDVVSFFLARG
ncbi:hypothetical protein SARC_04454 [Sphaeroforma arctica JP610]|uniref:Uncharacterized protein n=1 Tax=Sphaeroforma arctica JP610 TaxID=667725 RepID=A0A0L0G4V1_9EUKA|nr:hypothetical protein SARC_04454 [Sphaeroforma arctica JP610]KNC83293.1 hypothetical protein SARC_04454 [Sphaeroforma arctica JP610]|eukprot:XP_014157195.1 hypothetical protein SARC_04454 [Sphaeroforma arctica JP610]